MEEKELGFGGIDGSSRGFWKKIEQEFKGIGFLYWRMANEHIIIDKLLVSNGRLAMQRDTL